MFDFPAAVIMAAAGPRRAGPGSKAATNEEKLLGKDDGKRQ